MTDPKRPKSPGPVKEAERHPGGDEDQHAEPPRHAAGSSFRERIKHRHLYADGDRREVNTPGQHERQQPQQAELPGLKRLRRVAIGRGHGCCTFLFCFRLPHFSASPRLRARTSLHTAGDTSPGRRERAPRRARRCPACRRSSCRSCRSARRPRRQRTHPREHLAAVPHARPAMDHQAVRAQIVGKVVAGDGADLAACRRRTAAASGESSPGRCRRRWGDACRPRPPARGRPA